MLRISHWRKINLLEKEFNDQPFHNNPNGGLQWPAKMIFFPKMKMRIKETNTDEDLNRTGPYKYYSPIKRFLLINYYSKKECWNATMNEKKGPRYQMQWIIQSGYVISGRSMARLT